MARRLDTATLGDHLDRLYRAAWALTGSREDAEDLVQDTYARVLARPRFLRREDDLGYLLRVLRNTFLNTKRTAQRRPRTQPMAEGFEPVEERVSTQPDRALETKEVFEAVAALADDFRDVVVAVDVVGLSYAEAARALRLPAGDRDEPPLSRQATDRAPARRGELEGNGALALPGRQLGERGDVDVGAGQDAGSAEPVPRHHRAAVDGQHAKIRAFALE